MPLIPFDIQPGVAPNGQPFETGQKARWWRSNLVRFRDLLLAPVGGWRTLAAGLTGIPRGGHAWRDNQLRRRLVFGTASKLYVYSDTGEALDITPTGYVEGQVDGSYADGYGIGPYGDGTYGTPRTSPSDRLVVAATSWSVDNWGENAIAIANTSGTIYEWPLDTAEAVPLANAPVQCLAVVVTPERHLVALGAGGDPRNVRWSSQEDNTSWTPTALNTAGDLRLQTSGVLLRGVRLRGETLLITDQDAHAMRYLGPPLVYGIERVGSACGAHSAAAIVEVDGIAMWMGPNGIFRYDGVVQRVPSDVYDFVFRDLNEEQASKIFGGANPQFSEVWWCYPTGDAREPDRYIAWNYADNLWMIGEWERTLWVSPGVFPLPILGADGKLYEHEYEWLADGAPIGAQRWIESGSISIATGDNVINIMRMIPDERSLGETRAVFKGRLAPHLAETVYGPYNPAAYTDTRMQARQVAVRIEGVADADWRIGLPRFEVSPGGRR